MGGPDPQALLTTRHPQTSDHTAPGNKGAFLLLPLHSKAQNPSASSGKRFVAIISYFGYYLKKNKPRAIILDDILKTPQEIRRDIAARAQARRLACNMSQKELAARSGVSLGSVKRFETIGEISLKSLLAIALVLDDLEAFAGLFRPPRPENLFKTKESTPRKRAGRKRHAS